MHVIKRTLRPHVNAGPGIKSNKDMRHKFLKEVPQCLPSYKDLIRRLQQDALQYDNWFLLITLGKFKMWRVET